MDHTNSLANVSIISCQNATTPQNAQPKIETQAKKEEKEPIYKLVRLLQVDIILHFEY